MTQPPSPQSIKCPCDHRRPKQNPSVQKLTSAIDDYLLWMQSAGYAQRTQRQYRQQLNQFRRFIQNTKFSWHQIFTLNTLAHFTKQSAISSVPAINGLSWYLFSHGKIPQALPKKNSCPIELPKIYEDYLTYQQTHRQATGRQISNIKRILTAFNDYLKTHKIDLGSLKIEQVDAFLTQFLAPFAPASCRIYRSRLRGFLTYLYHEQHILKTDLAPLVVGRREYAQPKPPHFLRPRQVQKLFAGLTIGCASDIRTYAMVQLSYTMGLRPKEISRIRLDDITFSSSQLTLTVRKGNNPVELPVPEHTLKAIAAYLIAVRPQSEHRTVFLTLHPPFRPMSPNGVGHHITKAMKKVGLSSSAYGLRHTYAQNLLESGATIFEIKEMLGHDKIESTKLYLHVHIKLMRKVLFDEEF